MAHANYMLFMYLLPPSCAQKKPKKNNQQRSDSYACSSLLGDGREPHNATRMLCAVYAQRNRTLKSDMFWCYGTAPMLIILQMVIVRHTKPPSRIYSFVILVCATQGEAN